MNAKRFEDNPLKRTDTLTQAFARSLLRQALESDHVVVAVETDWHGRIQIKSEHWEDYWASVVCKLTGPELILLSDLRKHRQILSNSNSTQCEIINYCLSYYSLLDSVLKNAYAWSADVLKLIFERILGFECFALSDYYRGLSYLNSGALPYDEQQIFYPLRSFETSALFTSDGKSIFERLIKISKLTIIEDVDLSRTVLKDHLAAIRNPRICISEITRQGGADSASLFCVADVQFKNSLPGKTFS